MDSSNIKKSVIPVTLLVVYFVLNFFNPALVIYIKFYYSTFIIYVLNNNFNKLTLSYLYVLFLSKRAFNSVWEDSVHLSRTALVASFLLFSTSEFRI
jgi:hypothetical protein